MGTIKSFTDLSQSKVLAKILPLESADMYYALSEDESIRMVNIGKPQGFFEKTQVAWSLAALLNILPQIIDFKGDKYYLRFLKDYVEYANDEISITGRCLHTTGNNNLVDASYEMILKLHEHKMLNKC